MTLPAPLKTIAHFAALFFFEPTALGALFAGRTKRSTLFHFHVEAFGSKNIVLAQVTCTAAVGLACYFLIATDRIFPVFPCTLYSFLVQAALFGPWSRSSAFRAEILAIVTAALALAMFPVGAFMKTWINTESRIVDTESHIISILSRVPNIPPASPSPSASATPHQ